MTIMIDWQSKKSLHKRCILNSTSNVVILSIGLVSEYILYVNLKSSKESISKTSFCFDGT